MTPLIVEEVGPANLHRDLIHIYTNHDIVLEFVSLSIEYKLMFGSNPSPRATDNIVYELGVKLGITLECLSSNSFIITLTI